ncbi:MAG: hypothetical protein ACKVH8_21920 [Pirellulales bacterium]
MNRTLLSILFLCFILTSVNADPVADKPVPRLPWHVANIWWNIEKETPHFKSLEIDFEIKQEVSSDINLYIAPIGLGRLSGISFYGGIQTNCNGFLNVEDKQRKHIGKGAIFSRWGEGFITPDYCRKEKDGLMESAGYEGDFISVRKPIKWSAGKYTYALRVIKTVEEKDETYTWVGGFVREHKSDKEFPIGDLRFEGKDLTFWNRHSAFVEVYSTAKIRKSEIPTVTIAFDIPRINGKTAAIKDASAYYPNQGTAGSPDCARVSAQGSQAVVELTPEIFQRDEKRRRHPIALEK